ncbi:MAG: hypothetical protein JW952_05935, partial [Candidatus Eisenbacteria bacterium]|nr:hypothetical protein [Candidatus Eisenbacteria bacterium]
MRSLLIMLGVLMIPGVALARSNNNVEPYVYLEVLGPYAEEPTDPGPVPPEACVHPKPTEYPWTLRCYAERLPYHFYI